MSWGPVMEAGRSASALSVTRLAASGSPFNVSHCMTTSWSKACAIR